MARGPAGVWTTTLRGAVVERKVIAGADEERLGGGGAGVFDEVLEGLAEAGFVGDAFAVVILGARPVDEFAREEMFFGAGARAKPRRSPV